MNIDYGALGIIISILGIAIAVYCGLRGIPSRLDKIEKNTDPIKKIEETTTRLDERINTVLKFFPLKGTVEGILKNIGKVKVTAEPEEKITKYYLEIEKPILKEGLLFKISKETELAAREKELFGKESDATVISGTQMVLDVPSTDPRICSEYVSFFLRWLDSTYLKSQAESIKEFESITF